MINKQAKNPLNQKAGLLWKSIERQIEVQTGLVRLNKEVTLRTLINRPAEFLEANRFDFTVNLKGFLRTVVTMEPEKQEYFIFRVYDCYLRELRYSEDRNSQFSIDILFQVIETLTVEKNLNQTLEKYMDGSPSDALTKADLDAIMHHIKAFNLMNYQFAKIGNIRKAIEMTDQIILKIATVSPMVTVLALDSMFSLILAQNILSLKYGVQNLMTGWMNEYGFSREDAIRILPLFPENSSLNDFRTIYSQAMQVLVESKESENKEMDLFMLRTVCNYFTSWLNRVANQLPTAA